MTVIVSYIIIALLLVYLGYTNHVNREWAKKPLCNFPFKWRGKNYWYSRSCAVVLFTFCKDKEGNTYVLANQRGKGTPDYQGFWNAPCGYLNFSEKLEEACSRETLEETGIEVSPSSIEFRGISSDPSENRQNVTCKYSTLLGGTIDDYSFSTEKMEKDEVANIKWIKVNSEDLNEYQWAFGHRKMIEEFVGRYI